MAKLTTPTTPTRRHRLELRALGSANKGFRPTKLKGGVGWYAPTARPQARESN